MNLRDTYLNNLQRKPAKLESYSWADYIELLCLANIDGEISQADIIDRLAIRQKDFKEGETEDINEDIELDSDNGHWASNRARISDKWEIKLRDWFSILNMRTSLHNDFYPFYVDHREIKLKSKKITTKQRVYIYLLLCSNLNLFSNKAKGILANTFELVSKKAFTNILPKEAEVHLFGKNPYNKSGHFKNGLSFWKKINQLAKLINESISQKMHQGDYPENNRGDDGLDIVAWIPTMDTLSSKIIFLGQCACGTEWKKKQHESSFDAWSNKIDLTNYTINNIFIPYCFRKSNGEWHKPGLIQKSFLIDRKRLLEYCFKNSPLDYKALPSRLLVDEICILKEEII